MKKIKIFICLFSILILIVLITILINKNNSDTFMKDGVMFALTLDGKRITKFPEQGDYKVEVECENGTGIWVSEEWKVAIEDVSGHVTCNIDFTSTPTALKESVEAELKDNHITFVLGDYSTATTLTQTQYGTTSMYSSSNSSSSSGTTITNAFAFSGSSWSSVPGNLTSGTYYHIKMNVSSEAYYQLCYTISSGHSSNRLYVYKNTSQSGSYISPSTSSEKTGCIDIGKVTTSDYVKVTQRAYSSTSYGIATVSFYLKKTSSTKDFDAGYRYSGKTPNNYIWFNNELWRIIGSIPTCTSSGCGTSENLVKIIRDESIGGLAYDAKSSGYTGAWGSNTLYTLLNTYYYGAKDGTGTDYCYVHGKQSAADCDYTVKGIDSTGYYGKMIKNIYWNTGSSDFAYASEVLYANETEIQTMVGYVGLMSASDYGYAADSTYYNTKLGSYGGSVAGSNWLYGQGTEWTNTQYEGDLISTNYSGSSGSVGKQSAYYGYSVRPVVYLDSLVYVVSGDGTKSNPYRLAM